MHQLRIRASKDDRSEAPLSVRLIQSRKSMFWLLKRALVLPPVEGSPDLAQLVVGGGWGGSQIASPRLAVKGSSQEGDGVGVGTKIQTFNMGPEKKGVVGGGDPLGHTIYKPNIMSVCMSLEVRGKDFFHSWFVYILYINTVISYIFGSLFWGGEGGKYHVALNCN